MPSSNYPNGFANGITIRGVPLVQAQPGQVFFVGNSPVLLPGQKGGANGNNGTFLAPWATLDFAMDQCREGRGDVIFVLPGHRESIPDATTLHLDTANLAIIGLGVGIFRPTFTFTTATSANIPVRASGVCIQNCLFLANFAAIVSMFTGISASCATSTISGTVFNAVAATGVVHPGAALSGTGVVPGTIILSQLSGVTGGIGTYRVNISQTVTSTTITTGTPDFCLDNCEFRDLSSALNAVAIYTASATANASDGFTFTNNRITSLGTTAATTALKTTVAQRGWGIRGNFGNWAVLNDTAAMVAAGAANLTDFDFGNNTLQRPNTSSTGGSFISTSGTAWTGHCYGNYMYQLDATAGIWIATGTGGSLGFSHNFSPITGAVDRSGLLNPSGV